MPNLAARWRSRLAEVRPLHALLLGVAAACLVLRARSFLPFMADDAFISLRYARRLLDGHGLTWTDGQPVEGYSNLLWLLGCAALGRTGMDLVLGARCLGVAATLGTLLVLTWSMRSVPLLACAAGLAAFALTGSSAVWAIGGLEQPLLALWVVLGVASALPLTSADIDTGANRRAWRAGVFFGLAAVTRPDGLLFGAAVATAVLFARRPDGARVRMVARLAVPVLGMVLAQLLFRLFYYGDFVPNTGRAKVSLGAWHIVWGCIYIWDGMVAQRTILVPALAGFVLGWTRGNRQRVVVLAAPLVVWLGYLGTIGGDIFPAWRQLVPVTALAALLIAEGVTVALDLGAVGRWTTVLVLLNGALLGVHDERNDRHIRDARTERWEWNGEVIGRLLARAFGDRAPLLAVDPAGAVPYFSGLPALDMLGLNDAYLGRHPPANFGSTSMVGHELGNGPYVLEQKPDLVLFCLTMGSAKPCFRSGLEMVQLDDFRDHYQRVTFEGQEPFRSRSLVWVRRDSDKVGLSASVSGLTIPGYLLGDSDTVVARLDERGHLGGQLPGQTRGALPEVVLPAGRWSLMVDAPTEASLSVWIDGKQVVDRISSQGSTLALPEGARVEIGNDGGDVMIRKLTLTRPQPTPAGLP
jgi:arabinofuranosyltransferase